MGFHILLIRKRKRQLYLSTQHDVYDPLTSETFLYDAFKKIEADVCGNKYKAKLGKGEIQFVFITLSVALALNSQ